MINRRRYGGIIGRRHRNPHPAISRGVTEQTISTGNRLKRAHRRSLFSIYDEEQRAFEQLDKLPHFYLFNFLDDWVITIARRARSPNAGRFRNKLTAKPTYRRFSSSRRR